MVRLMKGEYAMRLEMWRMAMKMDAYARHEELQAALEAQMAAQGQGAGLRQLRQILARMVKGEMGMRVEIWRTATRDAGIARVQSEREARAAHTSKKKSLRQLRRQRRERHHQCLRSPSRVDCRIERYVASRVPDRAVLAK